ncbi:MAG: ATP-binding cassette domain-containing protein [Pirellulaceae bacterium]
MIDVRHLSKRFRSGGREVLAVDDVSFTVHPGEAYGLLGPNGAGKTTTIRMVVGLLRPDAGHAEVGGFRSSRNADEVKSRIGLVSAAEGVYPWLTVREQLLFFADVYGVAPRLAEAHIDKLCALFDLRACIDRRCANLSTGQKQRVTLARALMHDPPVMLLDEPTRGLDVIGTEVVFDYIAHLRQEGKAVIVCTHRLDEAERLCDRFGLLHQGRLRHEGTLAELREETGCRRLVEIFRALLRES